MLVADVSSASDRSADFPGRANRSRDGWSRGIGLAIATPFAEAGATTAGSMSGLGRVPGWPPRERVGARRGPLRPMPTCRAETIPRFADLARSCHAPPLPVDRGIRRATQRSSHRSACWRAASRQL
jgi:hypothetical protein